MLQGKTIPNCHKKWATAEVTCLLVGDFKDKTCTYQEIHSAKTGALRSTPLTILCCQESLRFYLKNLCLVRFCCVFGVLQWTSTQWKVFVANRVTKIQECIPSSQWWYVPTKQNPADLASRRLLSQELFLNYDGVNHTSCHGPQTIRLTVRYLSDKPHCKQKGV